MAAASKKEILSWSMYDFANSAFATTITAVVFQFYFLQRVVPAAGVEVLGRRLDGATLWAVTFATSLAISALMAPLVGAVCDFSASKKRYLTLFWLLGCASTMGFYFVRPGDWLLGSILYLVANVSFESSVSLNSAFLPELAPPEKLDRVSSIGWGIGYLGGGACLFLNGIMISHPDWFRIPAERAVNVALASVGLWWFVFGLPCILGVRERARRRPAPGGRSLVAAGFAKVVETLRSLKRFRTLAILTLSVLLTSAGVTTVLAMSTSYAEKALAFDQADLILCFLMIQGVAGVGALLTAVLASRVPTKLALCTMLFVWLGALSWAYFMQTRTEFWFLGGLIGLVMGGTQALSRGLQAQLTPPSSTAEFFGFYGVAQKLAAAVASYLFAAANAIGGIRAAIVSIMLLFLAGLWLLHPVNVARGRRESEEEELRIQAGRPA